jgi:hypothetical protein
VDIVKVQSFHLLLSFSSRDILSRAGSISIFLNWYDIFRQISPISIRYFPIYRPSSNNTFSRIIKVMDFNGRRSYLSCRFLA